MPSEARFDETSPFGFSLNSTIRSLSPVTMMPKCWVSSHGTSWQAMVKSAPALR
jgi:hypothetical protein